jgi:hypothetical protein
MNKMLVIALFLVVVLSGNLLSMESKLSKKRLNQDHDNQQPIKKRIIFKGLKLDQAVATKNQKCKPLQYVHEPLQDVYIIIPTIDYVPLVENKLPLIENEPVKQYNKPKVKTSAHDNKNKCGSKSVIPYHSITEKNIFSGKRISKPVNPDKF